MRLNVIQKQNMSHPKESIESPYLKIADKLSKEIDVSKLPLYGVGEWIRQSGDKYGVVKIKLDIEKDEEELKKLKDVYGDHLNQLNLYRYEWAACDINLPRMFERNIKKEISTFIKILSHYNHKNNLILNFSVVDGKYLKSERSSHGIATIYALIDLFQKV